MNRFTAQARRLAVAMALLAVALGGNAQSADVAPAPVANGDSLSMAFATTFGLYLRPALVNSYGEDATAMKAYTEGVASAFTTEPSREPYYRGVLEGMQLADRLARLRQSGVEVNLSAFLTSMRQYLVSGVAPMTAEAAQGVINRAIAAAGHSVADTLSLADEQRFLDTQFDRPGVVKLESGLLFEVLLEGEGIYPTMDSAVLVSYTGRLSDGTVFDHTDEPVTLDVAHVVAGMQEGLLMMKPGGRYRLFIPSWLGYGPEGIPGIIPGNAVLDFTVDLISVADSQQSE